MRELGSVLVVFDRDVATPERGRVFPGHAYPSQGCPDIPGTHHAGKCAVQGPGIRHRARNRGGLPVGAIEVTSIPRSGKIIVYNSKVSKAGKLGELLGCPVYHRNVDDHVGKTSGPEIGQRARIESWWPPMH